VAVASLCVEAGCKGSRCHKRRKDEETREPGGDTMNQVEEIEGKKQGKPKSEEESEEKEEKEEKKAMAEEAARRFRRAENELRRNKEIGETQGISFGRQDNQRSDRHRHEHRHNHRRHVTGYEHTHSKEAEPVGEVKDANLIEEKPSQRLRRAWETRNEEERSFDEDSKFAPKNMASRNRNFNFKKPFSFYINNGLGKHDGFVKNPRSTVEFGEPDNEEPFSNYRRPRHVTGEEHTHSSEQQEQPKHGIRRRLRHVTGEEHTHSNEQQEQPKTGNQRRLRHVTGEEHTHSNEQQEQPKVNHRQRKHIHRDFDNDDTEFKQIDLERRRYPTVGRKLGPMGREKALPLPDSTFDFPVWRKDYVRTYE